MKKYYLIGMVLLGLCLAPGLVAADKKKPEQAAAAINKLAWLVGHWRMEQGGRVIDEHWMAPAAGVMLGMARTVAKGKVVEYEFIQIREGPGGALFFISRPSGQKEAAFQLTALTDNSVVFENPQHDFPQIISYTLAANGSLLAFIEGPGKDGQTRRVEFPYQRVKQ